MTRGRRGEKAYTGRNGAATDHLRGLDKLRTPGSGVDGRWAPPSRSAVRKFIESQTCPWCGRGPFKMLATHTGRVHGVDASELRQLAGLTRHAPLCSEDHSARCAERHAGQALPAAAYERETWGGRVFSEAGRQAQRAKAAKVKQSDRERAARIGGDKQLATNVAKHTAIVRLYAEGVPQNEIAAQVGVSKPTVLRTLKREGVHRDGRGRRREGVEQQ